MANILFVKFSNKKALIVIIMKTKFSNIEKKSKQFAIEAPAKTKNKGHQEWSKTINMNDAFSTFVGHFVQEENAEVWKDKKKLGLNRKFAQNHFIPCQFLIRNNSSRLNN